MAEFVYNNKIHLVTKISPFRANCRQDPRIGFKGRIQSSRRVCGKNEEDSEKSKSNTEKDIGEDEVICR